MISFISKMSLSFAILFGLLTLGSVPALACESSEKLCGKPTCEYFRSQIDKAVDLLEASDSYPRGWNEKQIQRLNSVLAQIPSMLKFLSEKELATALYRVQHLKKFRKSIVIPQEWVELWIKEGLERLSDFQAHSLWKSMWSLASLGKNPGPDFMRIWQVEMGKKLSDLDAETLADILWVFTKFDQKPEVEFLGRWQAALKPKMIELGPESLATLVWDLGSLKILPDSEFMTAHQFFISQKIHTFNAGQLHLTLGGLAALGYIPDTDLLKSWQNQAIRVMPHFDTSMLCHLVYGFGSLGLVPQEDFFRAWQAELQIRLSSLNTGCFAKVLWSLALMDFFQKSAVKSGVSVRLLNEMVEHMDQTWFEASANESELRQLYTASQYLLQRHNIKLSRNLQEALKVFVKTAANSNSSSASGLQVEILGYIRKIFGKKIIHQEYWHSSVASPSDIFISSENLIIEVDGPSHYLVDSQGKMKLRPADQLRDHLLNELEGLKVVRIPYFQWRELPSHQKKQWLRLKIGKPAAEFIPSKK